MTAEVQSEGTLANNVVVSQKEDPKKIVEECEDVKVEEDEAKAKTIDKSSSYREESNFLNDLKEHERKALNDLKSKVEEAILGKSLFKKDKEETRKESPKEKSSSSGEVEEKENCEKEEKVEQEGEEEDNKNEEDLKTNGDEDEKEVELVDKEISIWGVPLLPSKGDEKTNVVLLKFLRARDFKVNEAFEMLKKTLQWRKDFKVKSILEEDFGSDLAPAAYMTGKDKQGHPICYNIFGVLDDEELYKKTFGTEEKRAEFLRWRVQLMEKGIQLLDIKPGGVSSLLQINDLKNSPGPSRKEVRIATKQAVALLQDNYPEFVAKNIFINVPFWYYAFHSVLSPFLTQRTKSKFIFARPANVTETLLKYIPIQEIPIQYGGLKRESDFDFSDTEASEVLLKHGSTETVEIHAQEVGTTFMWDVTFLGGEVNYKEEFVPDDENSYTIIIQKEKKVSSNDRNTFKTNEAGKIVLTFKNSSSKKKKAFYRHKIQKSAVV